MRKILTTICALFVVFLLPASFLVSQSLPTDTTSYVKKKYAGWNGVLQAWICCEWKPGGNLISWLNSCASAFEKKHNGVYIEFTTVDKNAMREMLCGNLRKPELIFHSPGVLENESLLTSTPASEKLRSDLPLNPRAVPVAMGGYIWVYNPDLSSGAPERSADLQLTLLPDEDARHFTCAALALLQNQTNRVHNEEAPIDTGIDLGLPTSAQPTQHILQSGDAFKRFTAGEIPCTIVTQYELKKLDNLQQSGRAPNWKCAAAGNFAWMDQLLYMSCVQTEGSSADERSALINEFAASLLECEAQQALNSIGAFSVTREAIHSDFSIYAALEKLILSRVLIAPKTFSEYCQRDCANIVREYLYGSLSLGDAFAQMGVELSLPIYPN